MYMELETITIIYGHYLFKILYFNTYISLIAFVVLSLL